MYKILCNTKLYRLICSTFYCILFVCIVYNQKCFARSSQTTDTIKLQLKWRNQFQFAGYYAAQIKGYYADQGLKVKILPGGPDISPVDNVAMKKADIGIFDPGILLKKNTVKDFVVLATIMQSSGYCIISLKEKNILKPADLIGKKVLVSSDQGWSVFKAILLKEGLDPGKVNVIERKLDSEEITDNVADAVVTYITSQPQRLKSLGYQINVIRPEEYGVDFYGDILFTTKDFAYQNTHITDAFIEASMLGWKYALTHENEIIDYILTLPDVKAYGVTRENLEYEAAEVRKLIMPNLVELGHTNLGRWQYMLTLLQKLGIADKNFSLKNFIYDTQKNRLSQWYLPIIYTTILILIVIVVIMLINYQLRHRIKISTTELRNEVKQREIAEQLANENKEQIELILNSSNIGLWELEVKSKKTQFNQQFKKVLGYSPEYSFLAKDFFEKIHPEDLKLAKNLFSTETRDTNSQKLIQLRIENANGEYIHTLSSSKLLFKDEQPFKISGIILSIQELKQKEFEVLQVSEELSRRNNELKKFAYITSHNLRAPIVNISSLSEMIDKSSLNTENEMIFEKITYSINKLESTLNDLVEVVSDEKSGDFSLEKIDIGDTIELVLNNFKNKSSNFKAEVNLDLKINDLTFSKRCFISIISNLLSNAIKFNTNHKVIINIETFQNEESIILKFSDNGIGIDLSKDKTRIFGLYHRINPQIEGKGIGLFIVKSHMDTFNGEIEIESELNNGTTFILHFPSAKTIMLQMSDTSNN